MGSSVPTGSTTGGRQSAIGRIVSFVRGRIVSTIIGIRCHWAAGALMGRRSCTRTQFKRAAALDEPILVRGLATIVDKKGRECQPPRPGQLTAKAGRPWRVRVCVRFFWFCLRVVGFVKKFIFYKLKKI